jgi:hypothetical protein
MGRGGDRDPERLLYLGSCGVKRHGLFLAILLCCGPLAPAPLLSIPPARLVSRFGLRGGGLLGLLGGIGIVRANPREIRHEYGHVSIEGGGGRYLPGVWP